MDLKRRAFLAALAIAPLVPQRALARAPEIFQTGGVAINGADPVAYFRKGGPDISDNAFKVSWRGAQWQFDSARAMTLFESNPESFAPRFGGYCAYAASKGYLAPTIPEAWTVHAGRLYLNASLRARELWLQDVPGNIAKGEANWPGILG
ncbi:MAG: YHS domain protein [Rhodobacteraceae bacterium]|nr:MAG: YHS domain protein [Paracoccaceae bacterium]